MSEHQPHGPHGHAHHHAPHSREVHDLPEGFRQLLGYRIEEWREGYCRLRLAIGPRHLTRCGTVHGGLLATLIEAAGSYAGCHCCHRGRTRRAETLSLNTQFVVPVRSGTIYAIGQVRGCSEDIFTATTEIRDGKDQLIALGEGTYRYRSGSRTAEGQPIESHHETRTTGLG